MLSGRLWVTIVVAALANALALGLAAVLLPGFTLNLGWWLAGVVLFTALSVVLRTLALRTDSRWLRVYTITGGLALTLIALAITDWIVPRESFDIEGWGTWIVVTLMTWAAGVAFGEVEHRAPEATPGVSPEDRAAAQGE